MLWILHVYFVYILVTWIYPYETRKYCWQVKDAEHRLRHKLFPANAWMKFFHCTLRPIGTVAGSIKRSDEDIPLDLIFFSPFEELRLRTAGIMESRGIHRVYEPSPVPTLYFGRVEDLPGGFHSFHAFWTEMQPQLFHISTAADRRTLFIWNRDQWYVQSSYLYVLSTNRYVPCYSMVQQ